jgi:hypothetical protein
MMNVTTVAAAYLEQDDRLALDCADGVSRLRLVLTRRITRRLLGACISLLERSSAVLAKAPPDLRSEVIGMEHLSALSQRNEPVPAPPTRDLDDLGAVLVTQIDLRATADSFILIIQSGTEPVARLASSRPVFHKTLALLDEWATHAEWNIGGRSAWLDAAAAGALPGRAIS